MEYEELKCKYNKNNKYVVPNRDTLRETMIVVPNNTNVDWIDIHKIKDMTALFTFFNNRNPHLESKLILDINWNTQHVKSFNYMFAYSDVSEMKLDWITISDNATISRMFESSRYTSKLPKSNLSFEQFVDETLLNVTPELIENNFNVSFEVWCSKDTNKQLMLSNKLYLETLKRWVKSDSILVKDKTKALSNIRLFDI